MGGRAGCPPAPPGNLSRLLSNHEQEAVVLGVQPAVGGDGKRGVGRTDGYPQEQLRLRRREHAGVSLWNGIHVSILAIGEDGAVRVDRRRIDAPLVPIWVVWVNRGALELPLG